MSFQIAPLRALRFSQDRAGGPSGGLSALAAPPYDVISIEEHRALLDRSPLNIVRLTLGDRPGERAGYGERAKLLDRWREEGAFEEDPRPALYVYGADYPVPGRAGARAAFRGLLALGSLHDFAERVVLPHERTFPDLVDDRYRILEATRTHLELILLLYADPERRIDALLEAESRGAPEVEVTARPGETHRLWAIRDAAAIDRLRSLFEPQRPIIADGHHRYTTACLYRKRCGGDPALRAGTRWQPMVLGNLFGDGLSILATHRLVAVGGRVEEALRILEGKLAPATDGAPADFEVETRASRRRFSIPSRLRAARRGVGATSYAILHDVVLGEWLRPLLGSAGAAGVAESEGGQPVLYFKEGTGERQALLGGKGDLLIRMRPVEREEFRAVVEGGEVFPHKTTYFYPKLWSGLVLWSLEEPEPAARA